MKQENVHQLVIEGFVNPKYWSKKNINSNLPYIAIKEFSFFPKKKKCH